MRISNAWIVIGTGLLLSGPVLADGTLVSWSPGTIEGMTETRWNAAAKLGADAVVDRLRGAGDWATAYEALLGASSRADDKELLGRIVAEISNPAQGSLTGTARLIVWDRVRSGEILFEGKGLVVEDDLFRVAGRANWILRTLLEKNFGYVRPSSTQQELDDLRQIWVSFLAGESVPEASPAYPSSVEGLVELRSPTALAALIVSLEPSAAKDALTASCLKSLYGLDQMPTTADSPAVLCSPDTYTHRYLATLTDVTEQHTAEWWREWWQKHGASLRWDSERAKFMPR